MMEFRRLRPKRRFSVEDLAAIVLARQSESGVDATPDECPPYVRHRGARSELLADRLPSSPRLPSSTPTSRCTPSGPARADTHTGRNSLLV